MKEGYKIAKTAKSMYSCWKHTSPSIILLQWFHHFNMFPQFFLYWYIFMHSLNTLYSFSSLFKCNFDECYTNCTLSLFMSCLNLRFEMISKVQFESKFFVQFYISPRSCWLFYSTMWSRITILHQSCVSVMITLIIKVPSCLHLLKHVFDLHYILLICFWLFYNVLTLSYFLYVFRYSRCSIEFLELWFTIDSYLWLLFIIMSLQNTPLHIRFLIQLLTLIVILNMLFINILLQFCIHVAYCAAYKTQT